MAGEGARAARSAPGGAGCGGTPGAQRGARPGKAAAAQTSPQLSANLPVLPAGPRRCSRRGSARGPAPRAAPKAGRRAEGRRAGRQQRRGIGKAPDAGRRRRPRGSEWQKKVWVSARGGCLGAASRKESPTPSQTLLASLALMRRSLRLGSLASRCPPPSRLARSLAGPAPGLRRAPAPARCQSVFHANPRAASFPSAVTAPLPPGLPAFSPAPCRLLPRAPCPPPASGRAPGLPPPGAEHAHVGVRGQRRPGLERAGPRAAPT